MKKFRDAENYFLVEGKRLVEEGIKSSHKCLKLILTNDFESNNNEFLSRLKNLNIPTVKISGKDFHKVSSTKNPQGVAALFSKDKSLAGKSNNDKVIAFENISDPGNLGTMLRTCEWFGIKNVILSKDCAELYNPKVLRASMGAVFHLSIEDNIELKTRLSELKNKGYVIYYADMNGTDYREIDFDKKTVTVFCNEAFGPSEELKTISNEAITIPKVGNIDSLNVSAAAAIIISKMV